MRSSLNLGARAVQSAGARGRVAELRPLTPAGKSATARAHKLGATARSLAILEHVASSQAPVDVLDIISSLKLPKATAYRRVEWFITQGYLSREPGRRRLIVGPKLANLAFGALSTAIRNGASHLVLQRLVRTLDETCNIGTLLNGEVIYLDRVEAFVGGVNVPAATVWAELMVVSTDNSELVGDVECAVRPRGISCRRSLHGGPGGRQERRDVGRARDSGAESTYGREYGAPPSSCATLRRQRTWRNLSGQGLNSISFSPEQRELNVMAPAKARELRRSRL